MNASQRQITKFLGAVLLSGVVNTGMAWASPCAIVDTYSGDSQILDRTRSQVVELTRGAAVNCGGWISVDSGWVRIKHQNGYFIHISPQTFVNLSDGNDPIVLYKGQIFAQAGGGTGEMRIATANGRIRVSRGKVIVSFNHAEDETQLITLENQAQIENRFATEERILVRAGEASQINVTMDRILPSIPAAISVSSLRPKMMALHLSESEQSDAVAAVTSRKERKFASAPSGDLRTVASVDGSSKTSNKGSKSHAKRINTRSIASRDSYLRHVPGPQDAKLRSELAKKIVGGEDLGTQILFPDRYYGRTQSAQITVDDPQIQMGKRSQIKNDPEKQRLIKELSQIRVE